MGCELGNWRQNVDMRTIHGDYVGKILLWWQYIEIMWGKHWFLAHILPIFSLSRTKINQRWSWNHISCVMPLMLCRNISLVIVLHDNLVRLPPAATIFAQEFIDLRELNFVFLWNTYYTCLPHGRLEKERNTCNLKCDSMYTNISLSLSLSLRARVYVCVSF